MNHHIRHVILTSNWTLLCNLRSRLHIEVFFLVDALFACSCQSLAIIRTVLCTVVFKQNKISGLLLETCILGCRTPWQSVGIMCRQ